MGPGTAEAWASGPTRMRAVQAAERAAASLLAELHPESSEDVRALAISDGACPPPPRSDASAPRSNDGDGPDCRFPAPRFCSKVDISQVPTSQ